MQTLGNFLKQKREARNLSLSDVAEYTKISKIYLNCLENNDFKTIPAKAYVKGYIASYAACVGIDQQEALKLYESFQNDANESDELTAGILPNQKNAAPRCFRLNKTKGLVLAAGMVVMLFVGIYYLLFENQKQAVANIGNRLEGQHNALNPGPISKIAYDLPQKKQTKSAFQSREESGPQKAIEARQIRTEHHDGMTQQLDLQEPQPLLQNLKETVSDQPIRETAGLNESPGSGNVPKHDENNLKIIEAAACSSVKDRSPQGLGNSFEWKLDKIFIWTRIECEILPSSIRHIYYFKGEKVDDISLNIRSSHWRTWSYKTLSNKRYIGTWRVDIASNDGKLLQSINFEIN